MEPGVEDKGCGELKGDCETRPSGSGVPPRVSSGAPVLHRPSDGSAEGLARGFVDVGTGHEAPSPAKTRIGVSRSGDKCRASDALYLSGNRRDEWQLDLLNH